MEQYTGNKIATFRERFAELCDSNPLNLTALAQELHVSKQTISAWKNGTRSPKAPTISAIAAFFGTNVEWIMGFDVPKEADNQSDVEKKIPIVVPDSERFVRLVKYMPYKDYQMVMAAFERAEKRMREAEGEGE